jgi:Rod binding domain-containing protein
MLAVNPVPALVLNQTGTKNSVQQTVESFEAVFLSKIVRGMREAFCEELGKDSGLGKDMYFWWIDQILSDAIAQAGGIGLKEQLQRWVQSTGEESSPDSGVQSDPGAVRSLGRF